MSGVHDICMTDLRGSKGEDKGKDKGITDKGITDKESQKHEERKEHRFEGRLQFSYEKRKESKREEDVNV